MKPKNLNLRSSRMVDFLNESFAYAPSQKMTLSQPPAYYATPTKWGGSPLNVKISFRDFPGYDYIYIDYTDYIQSNVEKVTKLSLVEILEFDTTMFKREDFEFTITYFDNTRYENGYYRYSFLNNDEKNRFMKLFDDDGWANKEVKVGDGVYEITRTGYSPYLYMYPGTGNKDDGLKMKNGYAIKNREVKLVSDDN